MPHRLCIHSMLHLLAILFCLFPTIIYADHQKGQFRTNHDNDQLHASHHEKGQLNANHDGQLNANHDGQLNANHDGQLNANHDGQLNANHDGQLNANHDGQLNANHDGQLNANHDGQLNANHDSQLNANHDGQLNANHDGQLNANHDSQLNANHDGQLNADKGQLKIRLHKNKGHAYVVIGHHYEYDYLDAVPPRRRIVRKEKAEAAKPEDIAKSMLGNANKEFVVTKADGIFYEMVTEEGWVAEKYGFGNNRFCRSFAYEFVCKLFNEKCPKQEDWPEEFLKMDLYKYRTHGVSVFTPAYKKTREHFKRVEDKSGCYLEDIELKIEVHGKLIIVDPKKLVPIGEFTAKDISHLIVQIQTRKVKYSSDEWELIPKDSFVTEEWAIKVDGHENIFKTKIKVFVCPGGHSYFRNLIILDETGDFEYLKIYHGDLKDEEHKMLKVDISKPIPIR